MKSLAFIIVLLFTGSVFGQDNKNLLEIARLTENFYVFTTYNSFKGTRTPSNGLYVVTSAGVVLIDTPWDSTQYQPLLDSIKARHGKDVVLCIATHSHEDRTGGLTYLKSKGIKTYTSKLTSDISEIKPEFRFSNDTTFTVGELSFETFYGGAGHTVDNIVIWFKKERILYGGCLIKSVEATDLGFTGEADLRAWPVTLQKLKKKYPNPKYVIPGHQGWADKESIDHTLNLLEKR